MLARLILILVNVWAYIAYFRLMLRYREKLGTFPNPAAPKTFNEKLLWRKLFDHNPQFTQLSDRLLAQDFICERCPAVRTAERLWVGADARDVPAELLAMPVVVKVNHGSAMNWFSRSGPLDHDQLARTFEGWLQAPFGEEDHEWGYYGVQRRLSVERFLESETGRPLIDLKIHVFDGEAVICAVFTDWAWPERRQSAVYDADGNRLAARVTGPFTDPKLILRQDFQLPDRFREAVECAREVSRGIDYVRVDFMVVDDQIYAGEVTMYCLAGYLSYDDPGPVTAMTKAWDLRKSWFLRTPQAGWRRIYANALTTWLDDASFV